MADPTKPQEVARVGRILRAFHMDSWTAPESYLITGISFAARAQGLPGLPEYQPYITIKIKVGSLHFMQAKYISSYPIVS